MDFDHWNRVPQLDWVTVGRDYDGERCWCGSSMVCFCEACFL